MTDIIKIEKEFCLPGETFLPTNNFLDSFDSLSIEDLTKLIIEIDIKAFYFKGKALQYIKENKRYKELGYKTFEAYVKDVLGFGRAHAYRLLNSSELYDNFVSLGIQNLPLEEKQIRPLIELEPEQRTKVWQEIAKDKVPTAKEVQEAVNKQTNKIPKSNKNTTKVDNNLLQENEQLKLKIKELEQIIENLEQSNINLTNELLKYDIPQQIVEEVKIVQEETLLTRTEMVETIKQHSTGFQKLILNNDKVTNVALFRTVVAIRNNYEENKNKIPNPLSERIMTATGPEPEENIGTLESLPNSCIKR